MPDSTNPSPKTVIVVQSAVVLLSHPQLPPPDCVTMSGTVSSADTSQTSPEKPGAHLHTPEM